MASYFDSPSGGGGYFPSRGRPSTSSLPPELQEQLLQRIEAQSAPASSLLLDAIDVPASYLRDALAGNPLGSRTSTGQLLDSFNLRPGEQDLGGWGRPLAEFAVGATLDPLNAIGVGGMNKAAKVARGVSLAGGRNLLDDAARVASRVAIQNNDLARPFAQNALRTWDEFGKAAADLNDADLIARPLVGTREARRGTTLEDLVRAQDPAQQPSIIQSINNQLKRSRQTYDDLAQQTLRPDIGIGMPFSDYSSIGFNIPGGASMARGLDRLGQMARWSGLGRHAHAAFNRDTFGATDEVGQIIGSEVAHAVRQADVDSGGEIMRALQDLEPDVFNDAALSQRVRRILGGWGDAADLDLIRQGSTSYRPDIARFVANWSAPGGLRETLLNERAVAGLASNAWESRFGGQYFPRHVDDLSFLSKIEESARTGAGKTRKGASSRAFGTTTGDMLARKKALDVPGGEDLLNRLSLDPNVAGTGRSLDTDDLAAAYIKQQVDAEIAARFPAGQLANGAPVPAYSLQSARRLARVLHQIDPKAMQEGVPIFGSHFTDDMAKYLRGNRRAIAIANTLYDVVGGAAKNTPAGAVVRGGHVPLSTAVKRLGLRTIDNRKLIGPLAQSGAPRQTMRFAGAAEQLLRRLSARFPGAADELKNFSLDKRMLDRLTRIADFYDYPQVQKGWIKTFDDITRIWKGSILAFPARFTRDWYSGAASNAVEVGIGMDLANGYAAAKYLIQGQWDRLDAMLARMPRYESMMTPQARKALFQQDLASSGLLGGRRAVDLADAADDIQSGASVADQYMPGMNPRTTLGYQFGDLLAGRTPLGADRAAYSELGKNWGRFFDMGMNRPRDVGNPILRWSQKLGDTTDSINRAAGYMGLLFKGIDPLEAARRMKAAHVDYNSLTTFERQWMRRFVPFWSYTSRVGKWVATKMWENPGGRYSQFMLRAPTTMLSRDNEYTPESIQNTYGMPVSPSFARPFGRQQEGATPWLTSIALPGVGELNMIRPRFQANGLLDISGTAWNTGLSMAGKSLHPALRLGVEKATGMNLYTRRLSKDDRPVLSEIAADAGIPPESMYGQWIKSVAPVADLVPFASRPLQVWNRLRDAEKIPDFRDRLYQMGVNAFTGVSFQNVAPEARENDVRRKIAEMTQEDPNVKSLTRPWIPDEARPFVNPLMVDLLDLDQQYARQAAKRRLAVQGGPGRPTRTRNTDPLSYFD